MTEEVTIKRCGQCKHLVRTDLKLGDCYGSPPTPVVLGGKPDALGRMALQVELLRPRVAVTERACSLYEFQLTQAVDLSMISKTPQETSQ